MTTCAKVIGHPRIHDQRYEPAEKQFIIELPEVLDFKLETPRPFARAARVLLLVFHLFIYCHLDIFRCFWVLQARGMDIAIGFSSLLFHSLTARGITGAPRFAPWHPLFVEEHQVQNPSGLFLENPFGHGKPPECVPKSMNIKLPTSSNHFRCFPLALEPHAVLGIKFQQVKYYW